MKALRAHIVSGIINANESPILKFNHISSFGLYFFPWANQDTAALFVGTEPLKSARAFY